MDSDKCSAVHCTYLVLFCLVYIHFIPAPQWSRLYVCNNTMCYFVIRVRGNVITMFVCLTLTTLNIEFNTLKIYIWSRHVLHFVQFDILHL